MCNTFGELFTAWSEEIKDTCPSNSESPTDLKVPSTCNSFVTDMFETELLVTVMLSTLIVSIVTLASKTISLTPFFFSIVINGVVSASPTPKSNRLPSDVLTTVSPASEDAKCCPS
jgi:hypothetical protein